MVNTDMLIHSSNIQAIWMIVFHYRACMDTVTENVWADCQYLITNFFVLIQVKYKFVKSVKKSVSFEALIFKLSTKIFM